MRRLARAVLLASGAAAVALLATALVVVSLSQSFGLPVRWEIPNGFRGWVVAKFGEPGCQPLARDGLVLVIEVSSRGTACTASAEVLRAWRHHRFEYVTSDGQRFTIPRDFTIPGDIEANDDQVWAWIAAANGRAGETYVFIGTKAEMEASRTRAPYLPNAPR